MESTTLPASPESPAPAPWSLFWPWPYLFVLLLAGGTAYGFFALSQSPTVTPASASSPGGFSAIAYSKSTGDYGSSSACETLAEAESLALSRCLPKDATIVAWSHEAWCALAVADDRNYGIAWGHNRAEVEKLALAHCREHSHTPCRVVEVVSAQGTIDEVPSSPERPGIYGAVAYSRSSGRFGSSQGCASLTEAEKIALEGCNASDAAVVIWCRDALCALAIAENRAFGYAWGHSRSEVEKKALEQCQRYAHSPCHIAVVVDSHEPVKR